MTSSEQVFATPELTNLVCASLEQRDRARLLRVSRRLFALIVPSIWANVPGAIHLLRLMPVTLGRSSNKECGKRNHLHCTIDTSRLQFYASFVQTLEISRSPGLNYQIEGDWRAHACNFRGPILLPNLRRLTYSGLGRLHDHAVPWITLFSSSSLLEIRINSKAPVEPIWQTMSSAAKLMQHLSDNCPRLRDMCIYPGEVAPYSTQRYPYTSRRFSYQPRMRFSDGWAPLGSRIASLFSLTSLTISPAVLLPQVFHAISKLENLETLRIRTNGSGSTSYNYKLDNLSFRALRTLELNHLEPTVLTHLCALQPLVSRLTDATVEFPDGEDQDWGFNQDRVETTLYKLCPLSPQLVKLQFDVGWWDDFKVSQRLIDMLRPLPLRRLCLRYLQLDNQQECAKLCDALPLVEEFALPGAALRFPQLQLLATKLPRLRILEVEELDLQGMHSTSTDKDSEKVASQLQNLMQIYAERISHGELSKVDDIARVLHSLWPGAVLSCAPGETEEMEDYTQINRIIFDLRSSSV